MVQSVMPCGRVKEFMDALDAKAEISTNVSDSYEGITSSDFGNDTTAFTCRQDKAMLERLCQNR